MKFTSLKMLFLIWTAPVLLLVFIHGMRRRRAILQRFSTARGLSAIAGESDGARRWIKNILILVVVLFTALALAGPQYGYRWEEVRQEGVDIVVALDCSRSMLAEDISPSRLDRAKREIVDLLQLLRGDRVGLVAFAGTAFVQCPLTLDYGAFHIFLDVLAPDYLPVPGTDIPGAVRVALSAFSKKEKSEKAIILITDGESTTGDALDAADEALAAGVKLFCIGVGGHEGAPMPDEKGGFKKDRFGNIVISRLDEDTLKQMAVKTGGAYVRSLAGNMDLDIIYTEQIRGGMKTETLSAGKRQVWENRYQWALMVALLAFCLELFIRSINPKALGVVMLLSAMTLSGQTAHGQNAYDRMRDGAEAYQNEKYENALDNFIGAQLEAPDRPEIFYNLGNVYYKMEDYEAAEKQFVQSLSAEEPLLREKALYNLGNTYFRRQKFDKAIENYKAALKIDPEDKEAKANLSLAEKLLRRQQQEQEGQSGQDQPDQDQKGDESQGGGEQKGQSDRQRQASSSDQPKEGRQGGSQSESQQQQAQAGQEPDDPGKAGVEKQAAVLEEPEDSEGEQERKGGGSEKGENGDRAVGIGNQQAETMLNRLEDKPGRALIPAYTEREVERDW